MRNNNVYWKSYDKALELFLMQKDMEANHHANIALTMLPNEKEVLILYARIQLRLNNLSDAEKVILKCLAKDALNRKAIDTLYKIYIAQKRFNAAINILKSLTISFPEDTKMKVELVDAYCQNGQLDLAVEYLEKQVQETPNNVQLLYHLGDLLVRQGFEDRAISIFNKCLVFSSTTKKPLYQLGLLYIKQYHHLPRNSSNNQFIYLENAENKKKLCKHFLNIDQPKNATWFFKPEDYNEDEIQWIYSKRYKYLKNGDVLNDVIILELCVRARPNNLDYVMLLYKIYNECKDYISIVKLLERYIEINQDDEYINFKLGRAYYKLRQYEKAIDWLWFCHIQNRANIIYIYYLGLINLNMGNTAESKWYFHRCLELNKNHTHSLFQLGVISEKNGDIDAAQGYYEHCLKIKANDEYVQSKLSRILISKGDLTKAHILLSGIKTKDKVTVQVIIQLVAAYIDNGDINTAIKWLKQVPIQYIENTNYEQFSYVLTDDYSIKSARNHIKRHFDDNLSKPIHGVFTITETELDKVLESLGDQAYDYKEGLKRYIIPYPNAGYAGGSNGDIHIHNFISVFTFISNDFIITAYPSDGMPYAKRLDS